MDQIVIKNLTVFANHGVLEAETLLGQKFVISAILDVDLHPAAQSDALKDSVDYGEICNQVTDFFAKNTFQLIETAAEQLIFYLLRLHPTIQKIDLTLEKPWAPIHLPLESVGVHLTRSRHIAFLGMGSNLGEKETFLNEALQSIATHPDCRLIACSDFIATAPYGKIDQPDFLNGVCQIETLLSPKDLLNFLHEIEAQCKRERLEHWGPRTLDLDILFYDDCIYSDRELTIPHIDLHNRMFVLKPMMQIAPYHRHPVFQTTIAQLYALLEQ